jgi:hypothetical protein
MGNLRRKEGKGPRLMSRQLRRPQTGVIRERIHKAERKPVFPLDYLREESDSRVAATPR